MSKKILIDIGHPAQVHCFKNIYKELKQEGHQLIVTSKDKEITKELLNENSIPYILLNKRTKSRLFKFLELPRVMFRFGKIIRQFEPDLILCRFSLHSVWIGRLFGTVIIGLADSEHTKKLDFLTKPMVQIKLTGDSYSKNLGKNHLRFPSNLEMLYLHSNRFSFDIDKIDQRHNKLEIAIVRFVSWKAHHDVGEKGISNEHKKEIIQLLNKKFKVLISSEEELPDEFKKYEFDISPNSIHHYIKYARLYVGEGASMASESACLGTTVYYVNSLKVGYIEEQVKFGLCKSFRNSDEFMSEFNSDLETNFDWYKYNNYLNYISRQIDSTSVLKWIILNYPFKNESFYKFIDNSRLK